MQQPMHFDPRQAAESLSRVAEQSQRMVAKFLTRQPEGGGFGMGDPSKIGNVFADLTQRMMADPVSVATATWEAWNEQVKLLQHTAQRMLGAAEPIEGKRDRRFRDPAWSENAVFEYVKQSYLLSADAILSAVRKVDGLDPKEAQKVEFYTRQFVDAIAPSNFVATNPEVLKTTLETGGNNLLDGLANLLEDLERGEGRLAITMTSRDAFRIGENIATTPGKVILQNDMMQLVQYTPTTAEVRRRPLLIVPPLDQQVLHPRPAAGELVHPLGGRAGPHGIRDLVDQSGRAPRYQKLRGLHGRRSARGARRRARGDR